jgi:hypothetical protein
LVANRNSAIASPPVAVPSSTVHLPPALSIRIPMPTAAPAPITNFAVDNRFT